MDTNDPLSKLVVDTNGLDRQKLADLLGPYVFFDQISHKMSFTDKFNILDKNADRLEIVFLADKARALFFKDEEKEGLSQVEFLALEIMPAGSIKSTLKQLFDNRKVLKNNDGKYYIPGYRLSELISKFGTK